VVTNSTVLIALDRIQRVDLLVGQFQQVIAPPAVLEEVGMSIPGVSMLPVANHMLAAALKTQVGPGESEAIALAAELPDLELILDDRKARRLAGELGLRVVGTVGLVLRARRRGMLTAAAPVLHRLVQTGFRISPALFAEALRLAREEER
jgi:predicted nucleic acid-binding protein